MGERFKRFADNKARISPALQGWPTNSCCRSEHLRCSEMLLTILVIRIFTVLSLDWGRKIIWNCSLSRHWLVMGRITVLRKAPVRLCRSAGIQTQKEAGLCQAVLLERSLTMGDFPASALLRASLAGLCGTATKGHKYQNTPIYFNAEDFCQGHGWFLKSLINSGQILLRSS